MVFSLSALWWRRTRGLWKLPDRIDWLKGKLGFVLVGRAMLSKYLIQFSVDEWSCISSLLFTWVQTMVEAMKIMVTSFKWSHACTAILSAPNPAGGHYRPMPPPESPGHSRQVWVSLFCGHCSFLLGPGVHKVLFVPAKNLFPLSCVKKFKFSTG